MKKKRKERLMKIWYSYMWIFFTLVGISVVIALYKDTIGIMDKKFNYILFFIFYLYLGASVLFYYFWKKSINN